MKKAVAILLVLVTIFALAGCGVTNRQYRRYSYNKPATDYTLGNSSGGAIYDGSNNGYSRARTGAHLPRSRNNLGGINPDSPAAANRGRFADPGDFAMYREAQEGTARGGAGLTTPPAANTPGANTSPNPTGKMARGAQAGAENANYNAVS